MDEVIIEIQKDANTKEVFEFYFNEGRGTLYLEEYRIEQRATPRHKFKPLKAYSRLTPNPVKWIMLKDVPLTEEIKKLAMEKFVSQIKVDVWDDARGQPR